MKKNKIIGVCVGLLGMMISVGGAIALYQKGAEDVEFGFGGFTYTAVTADLEYKVGDAVVSAGNINPNNLTKTVQFPLSAVYPIILG